MMDGNLMAILALLVFVFARLEADWLRTECGNRFIDFVLKRDEQVLKKRPSDSHTGIPIGVSYSAKRLLLVALLGLIAVGGAFLYLTLEWASLFALYAMIFIWVMAEISYEIENKIIYYESGLNYMTRWPGPPEESEKSE